jgi:hypothetical protein
MLDTNDLGQIRQIVREEVHQEIRNEVGVSEKRTAFKIEQPGNDIAAVIDNTLFPLIAGKADKSDIKRLTDKVDRMESKLDWVVDKVADHDTDIKKLKAKVFSN